MYDSDSVGDSLGVLLFFCFFFGRSGVDGCLGEATARMMSRERKFPIKVAGVLIGSKATMAPVTGVALS